MFKSLFGGKKTAEKPEEITPSKTAATAAVVESKPPLSSGKSKGGLSLGFISHQPIYDPNQKLVAYEFLLKDSMRRHDATPEQHAQFDLLMLSTLINLDLFSKLSNRKAIVQISMDTLNAPELYELPANLTLLVLDPKISDLNNLNRATIDSIQALKKQGFRLAVDPIGFGELLGSSECVDVLLREMSFFTQDFSATADEVLAPFFEKLPAKYPNVKWFARNVGSYEEYEVCQKNPALKNRFILYHGSYITKYKPQENVKIDVSHFRVMEIMRMLRGNAEGREIEEKFKLDSVLMFKLLRFINSPANGLSRKIMSIQDTIVLLGRDSLFKWLSLLLFTARKDDSGRSLSLLEKSLWRAKLLELIALKSGKNRLEAEHLFLTGMFSMLEALLEMPMAQALEPLDLPGPVSDALLYSTGNFAPYLQLCVLLEDVDTQKLETLTQSLGISVEDVNLLHLQAITWSEQVLADGA